jgi:hypothetical protein
VVEKMILMKYPRFYLKYGFSYVNQKELTQNEGDYYSAGGLEWIRNPFNMDNSHL